MLTLSIWNQQKMVENVKEKLVNIRGLFVWIYTFSQLWFGRLVYCLMCAVSLSDKTFPLITKSVEYNGAKQLDNVQIHQCIHANVDSDNTKGCAICSAIFPFARAPCANTSGWQRATWIRGWFIYLFFVDSFDSKSRNELSDVMNKVVSESANLSKTWRS